MGCKSSRPRPRKREFICDLINSHRVVLFSKTRCVHCMEVKRMLNEMGYDYATVELDLCDYGYSGDLVKLAGFTTVPILFIDGKLIGGKLDIARLKFSGQLKKMIGKNAPRRHHIGPMYNFAMKKDSYF